MKCPILHFLHNGKLAMLALFTMLLFAATQIALGQENSQEPKKKSQVKLGLSYIKDNGAHTLQASVRAKVDGRNRPVESLEVSFYKDSISEFSFLGKASTDDSGKATYQIQNEHSISIGTTSHLKFFAFVPEDDNYKKKDRDLVVKDLRLELNFKEKDSLKFVSIKAFEVSSDSLIPVSDLDLTVNVKRLFSLYKIEKVSTNEDGFAEIEFPSDLPAIHKLLTVVVKVDDNDDYGTVLVNNNIEWGVEVEDETLAGLRTLWTPNAPMWMVILFIILMAGVWGHFYYIVYALFRVKNVDEAKGGKIIWDDSNSENIES